MKESELKSQSCQKASRPNGMLSSKAKKDFRNKVHVTIDSVCRGSFESIDEQNRERLGPFIPAPWPSLQKEPIKYLRLMGAMSRIVVECNGPLLSVVPLVTDFVPGCIHIDTGAILEMLFNLKDKDCAAKDTKKKAKKQPTRTRQRKTKSKVEQEETTIDDDDDDEAQSKKPKVGPFRNKTEVRSALKNARKELKNAGKEEHEKRDTARENVARIELQVWSLCFNTDRRPMRSTPHARFDFSIDTDGVCACVHRLKFDGAASSSSSSSNGVPPQSLCEFVKQRRRQSIDGKECKGDGKSMMEIVFPDHRLVGIDPNKGDLIYAVWQSSEPSRVHPEHFRWSNLEHRFRQRSKQLEKLRDELQKKTKIGEKTVKEHIAELLECNHRSMVPAELSKYICLKNEKVKILHGFFFEGLGNDKKHQYISILACAFGDIRTDRKPRRQCFGSLQRRLESQTMLFCAGA